MAPTSVLLDSHVLIWWINEEKGIGPAARRLIDEAPKVYVSAASIWELRIKASLGQIPLSDTFETDVLRTGFIELPVTFGHSTAIRDIRLPQGDPFDKLLVAAASVESLLFLTADTPILSVGLPFAVDVGK